jgi:hypothetical protein
LELKLLENKHLEHKLKLRFFLVVSVLVLTLVGCKAGQWKKSDRENDQKTAGAIVEPKRLADADATAANATTFEMDEKTGRIKQSLVLRLDYFPKTETSGTNLPACYGAFRPDFQLGYFSCVGQPDKSVALNAGHLSQDCYTNPRFNRVQPSTPIVMVGCPRGNLVLHSFDPTLRVDVEQREAM